MSSPVLVCVPRPDPGGSRQLPVKAWHKYIGEPAVADAALDRIVHNAHQITLNGESMRKTRSTLTEEALSAN